jgi:hypothetical protein
MDAYISESFHIACRRHYVVVFLYHKMDRADVCRKQVLAVLVLVLTLKFESKPTHMVL